MYVVLVDLNPSLLILATPAKITVIKPTTIKIINHVK
jgi:hypothetical protein